MRGFFQVASIVLLALGAGITAIATFMIGFALFAPTQPPPTLNEGHGLAFFLGAPAAFIGLGFVAVGGAIRVGVKKADRGLVAAEPDTLGGRPLNG